VFHRALKRKGYSETDRMALIGPLVCTKGPVNGLRDMARLSAFLNDESGTTAIEYGLIAGLVSLGIIGGLGSFMDSVNAMYTHIIDNVSSASP
jgi:pilus assembly protein Flp/PilA